MTRSDRSKFILTSFCAFLALLSTALIIALIVVSSNKEGSPPQKRPEEKKPLNGHRNNIEKKDDGFPIHISSSSSDDGGKFIDEKEEQEYGETDPWEKEVRLPKSVIPYHYDLYLHPNLKTGMFMGRVGIHIGSQEYRDYFIVHSHLLNIENARMYEGHVRVMSSSIDKGEDSRTKVDLVSTFVYTKNEYFVFRTDRSVKPNNYTLYLEFSGNLTGSIVGFYKSVYTNSKGKVVPIATSKFQPTHARRAFPCFDEPSFKSTFSVSLIRPTENYIALSNMPVYEQIQDYPSQGTTMVKFVKSVPMVTYLACFIVCDFEYEEKLTPLHGTKFRVYATPNQKHRINYALNMGTNISDFYVDYFQIPYPLPKQDMIAIPDFASGAMEHWGLITYRETALLYDDRESSSSNKQRVAVVVSHELAHQWFGNLVTLSWWDDLWLNEGFASFIEYKGIHHYHPKWQIHNQFLTSDLHQVMDLDSTINSHPIIQAVEHPDQINEIFDVISYSKGASVLRMLENFMGEEEFRVGIGRFLEKFKFDNAVTPDLWRELEKISSQNLLIGRIMDTWTKQMGLPLVTVIRIKENTYRCVQSRFLLDSKSEPLSDPSLFNYKWEIPLTWITEKNNEVQRIWLRPEDPYVEINIPSDTKWVKFNQGQFGYYRVNYPSNEWVEFGNLLVSNKDALGVKDRASLINDAFALAASGRIEYSIPLKMLQYLKQEDELVPWITTYNILSSIQKLLKETEIYPGLRKFILSLTTDHYVKLGWFDEGTHVEKLTRVKIIKLSCKFGDKSCLNEAKKQFERWILEKNIYIAPNLRSMVYKYGMYVDGSYESWKILFERYKDEINAQEKKKMLYGLAWPRDPWILRNFLNMASNDSIIREQDYFTVVGYIANNPIGRSLVWNFIRENWISLVNKFSLNNRRLGRTVKYVISSFSTKFQLQEVQDFFNKYPEAGAGSRARKQGIEKIENNILWIQKHSAEISLWLNKNGYSD